VELQGFLKKMRFFGDFGADFHTKRTSFRTICASSAGRGSPVSRMPARPVVVNMSCSVVFGRTGRYASLIFATLRGLPNTGLKRELRCPLACVSIEDDIVNWLDLDVFVDGWRSIIVRMIGR
jgi:hypothetical protein